MSDKPGYLTNEGGIARQSMKSRYKFDNAGRADALLFGLEIFGTPRGMSQTA